MTGRSVMRHLCRLRRRIIDERGITLTEMVVTMAIMGVVIAAVGILFESGSRAEANLNLRFASQSEARIALDVFRREAHNACLATVSGTSGPVVDPSGTTVTRYPTVLFKTLDSSYGCTVTSATWCTVGSGSSYELYRQSGAGSCTSSSARRAQYLTNGTLFTYTSTPGSNLLPTIGIDLTVNQKPSAGQFKYRIHDEIVIRNGVRS